MLHNDPALLEAVIQETRDELLDKQIKWTYDKPIFDNFDCQASLGIDPAMFAVAMCQVKMNRVLSAIQNKNDDDLYDSLKDLTSYSLFARALLKRKKIRAESRHVDLTIDQYIHSPEGLKEIEKMAKEIMGDVPSQSKLAKLQLQSTVQNMPRQSI
jgi:hypothetical protein